MPVYELLCLSFASCCLPSNCLQAMADGLQSCLSPVQSISTPPLATSSSHSSWAGSCKGWQELARKGRYVTATGTTNHYIQNTLNAALRLNAAELVLSFTESQQHQVCWPPSIALPFLLGPAQQYREAPKLSSIWPHASSETAAAGTPVPQVCQHSSQQTGAGTATGSLEELGYILQSSLLQNWNKSTSLP